MIIDRSGIILLGLGLLRRNLAKLGPPKSIELKIVGNQQVVVVNGPQEVFESNSFGWGRDDDRTHALAEALKALGWPTPVEQLSKMDPDKETTLSRR